MAFICKACQGRVGPDGPQMHGTPCSVCGKNHPACFHHRQVGWVCPEQDCEKVIPGRQDSPESRVGRSAHLKEHGGAKGRPPAARGSSGKGSSGGGWVGGLIDGVADAVGDIIGSILD